MALLYFFSVKPKARDMIDFCLFSPLSLVISLPEVISTGREPFEMEQSD